MSRRSIWLFAAASGMAVTAAGAVSAGPADTVYLPVVVKGETEFELRGGFRDFANAPSEHAFVFDIGYGVTDNWRTELVFEHAAEGGNPGRLEAWEWENVIVLTEQGKNWADLGVFAEYEHAFKGPGKLKIGPMVMKEIGPTVANLNLLFVREVGKGASAATGLDYTWQVKWRGREALEWGLQGFGSLGTFGHLGRDDSHILGPALFGARRLPNGNKLVYNAAILGGLNAAAPDVTVRFQLEYEMF